MEYRVATAVLLFLAVLTSATVALIYKWPRSPLFWKRTDYLYFGLVAVSLYLGIVGQHRDSLLSQMRASASKYEDTFRTLILEVDAMRTDCEEAARIKRIAEQQERDKKAGIIRPEEDDFVKPQFQIQMLPNDSDCDVADAIHTAFLRERSKESVEDPMLVGLLEIKEGFTESVEMYAFGNPLDDCSKIPTEWARVACGRFSEMNEAQGLYRAIQERINEIQWASAATSYWHLFLAVALGIRVAKIHAEIREVKSGKPRCRRFKLPKIPSVRLSVFPSLFKPRVSTSQRSDLGGNGER